MKKVTKTTTTTPATPAPVPAKKSSEKTAKKAPSKASVALAKPVGAPAVKAVPSASPATKIVAQIDVGFGNTLYVRGEGAGLSWEKGVPLDCVADDQWALTLSETARPVVFKFLINDLTWSLGEDYVAHPGTSAVLVPVF